MSRGRADRASRGQRRGGCGRSRHRLGRPARRCGLPYRGRTRRWRCVLALLQLPPGLLLPLPPRPDQVTAVGALLLLARAPQPHPVVREKARVQRLEAEAQPRVARELPFESRHAPLHLLALTGRLAPVDSEEVQLEAALQLLEILLDLPALVEQLLGSVAILALQLLPRARVRGGAQGAFEPGVRVLGRHDSRNLVGRAGAVERSGCRSGLGRAFRWRGRRDLLAPARPASGRRPTPPHPRRRSPSRSTVRRPARPPPPPPPHPRKTPP